VTSPGKKCAVSIWDEKGVSPVNFVPKGTALKSDLYIEVHLRLGRPKKKVSEV
jgi:hypothetical protein